MTKLTLRTPWTSQPQTPTGIDPKWIARGLAFAAIPGQAEYFSQKLPVQSGSSYLKVNPAGRAFSSPDTQIPGAYTYTVNIPSSFDNTVIVIVRSPVAQAASAAVPTLHFNSAEPVLFCTTGSQTVYSTTGNASTTITTLTAGNVNALVGVKRVNSQEQYVNGGLATTNVTGNRAIGAITTVSVGRPSGGNNIDEVEYAGIFYFTKALSASEIAELTRHYSKVWQVYQPIQRTIWIPSAGGGGGTTYTMTPGGTITFTGTVLQRREHVQAISGSISFSGTSSQLLTRVFSPSGSITFSGDNSLLRTRLFTPSGNITFSGTAPFSQNNTYTLSPGGTITFSGTGGQVRERVQIATGNITFSGAVELLRTRTMVPTGDITFSGSATETRIRVIAPTGQITFTGTAPLIDPNAVGGVTTWRTLTGMGN